MRNNLHFRFLCGTLIMVTYLMSCGKSIEKIKTSNTDSISMSQMSVQDAEEKMFYKMSSFQPTISVELNAQNNKGDVYHSTRDYLENNGIKNALVDWLIQKSKVPQHQTTIYWDNTPIDTLFLDDFEFDENGFLGTKKEIIQVLDYDITWCSIISEALYDEPRDQQIVKRCKTSRQNAEFLMDYIQKALESYKNQKHTPHIPLIYVYSFHYSFFVGCFF